MTREEAAKQLSEWKEVITISSRKEAINMAIKALEQEPCEDAVSREWLISELRNRKVLFCKNQIEFKLLPEKDKARVDEIDTWIGEFLNAPPVTPKCCPNCGAKITKH